MPRAKLSSLSARVYVRVYVGIYTSARFSSSAAAGSLCSPECFRGAVAQRGGFAELRELLLRTRGDGARV